MFRTWMKTFTLVVSLILALAVLAVAAPDPKEVAKQVIDKALGILNDPALAGPAHKNQRFQMVKQIVDRHFDYREMAKRSLGATWSKLNNSQRDEFVRIFAELLEASYADKIDKYAKHVRVDYIGETLDGDYAECAPWWCAPTTGFP